MMNLNITKKFPKNWPRFSKAERVIVIVLLIALPATGFLLGFILAKGNTSSSNTTKDTDTVKSADGTDVISESTVTGDTKSPSTTTKITPKGTQAPTSKPQSGNTTNTPTASDTNTATPTSVPVESITSWITYKNLKYGYTLSIPDGWRGKAVEEPPVNNTSFNYAYIGTKAEVDRLAGPNPEKLNENAPQKDSNIVSTMTVSVTSKQPTAPSNSDFSEVVSEDYTVNGVKGKYYKSTSTADVSEENSMPKGNYTKVYIFNKGNIWYSIYQYDHGTISQIDYSVLDKVMQSLKF